MNFIYLICSKNLEMKILEIKKELKKENYKFFKKKEMQQKLGFFKFSSFLISENNENSVDFENFSSFTIPNLIFFQNFKTFQTIQLFLKKSLI